MIPTDLSNSHRTMYESILRHPAPHSLHWRDVRSMLDAIGVVTEEPNGKIKVTRNGQTLVLHPEGDKDVESSEQIKALRVFLKGSGDTAEPPPEIGVNLLVVIDHREARVYKTELRGTVPERITPFDPHGAGRYLHYVDNDSNGQRRPERRSYYDAIAASLRGAVKVLVFGGGTGAASAMEQMVAEFNRHHKDIAERIVGTVTLDEHHMTEDQLLAKARDWYTKSASAEPQHQT